MALKNVPTFDEPVEREYDPAPPGRREPSRKNVPVQEPPEPVNQPDGIGEPDEVDERGDVINPPVRDPALEPDEPARDGND
jgi:hypothetical protein